LLTTTLVANWLHAAGISQAGCSNRTLPSSPLIAAVRNSHSVVSNGVSASTGQKTGCTASGWRSVGLVAAAGLGETAAVEPVEGSNAAMGHCSLRKKTGEKRGEEDLNAAGGIGSILLYTLGVPISQCAAPSPERFGGGQMAGLNRPQRAEGAKKSEVQKAAPSACYRNMLCLQHSKTLHMDPKGPGRECSVRIV
jgi:hypothetical protein